MATRIQLRRDTEANWTSNDPILAEGEVAISLDLEKIKIGDGSSSWSELDYINLTPTEIQNAIDSAVSSVVDGSPALLDTLNELAAALGDDENFASTITNSLADKLDISTASSTYLTQANAASTYDAIGSASTAQSAAESYADSLATNYDPAGSASAVSSDLSDHELSTTSVHGITNTADLATKSYADTAESDAVSSANSYSDSLATNYDAAGSATTAQSNANTYTDTEISTHNSDTTDVHGIADTSELATKTYADSAASNAAASLVDSAPSTLDTLNELAAALGDDPNFATTVANSIAAKADDADLTSHENATTSVHGIADTSLLATTSYVDTAESDAVNTANTYSDSLATNYDSSGSAAAAQSAAESYADGLAVNYDSAGSASTAESNANTYTDTEISTHNSDTTAVHGIADTSLLATTSYVDTAESDAVSSSNSYADSLASNYDPAGSSATAQSNAESYSDSSVSTHNADTTNVHGIADTSALATKTYADNAASTAAANLIDSAPGTLDTLNELAAALGDDPNFATTITNSIATKANDSDLTDHENATTNVHGITDTSLLATTAYVDTAESDAVTTANAYSDSLSVNYDSAGSASAAQSAAESYADSLATNYDPAGSASSVASDLTDHENATTSVHGIADTSLLATTSYVDTAESDAITTANAYSDSLATNYDPAGSAFTAESNANTYTNTEISTHNSDTTNVHGIVDTSALATKTYADNAASTAAANLIDSAPATLDTLNELAAALGDDPNFATTITNSLSGKQPLDADLTAIAALIGTSGLLKKTAVDTWSLDTNTYLTGNQTITLTGDVSGSGTTSISVTIADDSHNHIIGNVDGLQTALDAKAPLASPELTGTPTAPTASSGTDTTQIATTEYVQNELSSFSTLPDQTGNAGEYLTTDGASPSWAVLNVEPTIHPMFLIGGV